MTLPIPNAEAMVHSERLCAVIRQAIAKHDGVISFAEYMQLALYAPGLGYYSAGNQKFGAEGDFITAPDISPLFGQCLANVIQPVLQATQGDILELGGGQGRLAVDVLGALSRSGQLPQHYYMLEVSPDLRARQREMLEKQLPGLASRVIWLDQPPTEFNGVILANEVLDALPVHRFVRTQAGIEEWGVGLIDQQFNWKPLSQNTPGLEQALGDILTTLATGYTSEVSLQAPALVKQLAASLQKGIILLIDYGFLESQFYHPDRDQGTLMCHYRHYAHTDPFLYPGLQDITAHVNFSAVGQAAEQAGLTVTGFATQAQFLLAAGLIDLVNTLDGQNNLDTLRLSQQIQTLTAPHEMGELFKVMALSRALDIILPGF